MKYCAAFTLPTLVPWDLLKRLRPNRLNGAAQPDGVFRTV